MLKRLRNRFVCIDGVCCFVRLWNGVVPDRCRQLYKRGEEWQCFFGHKLYSTLTCELRSSWYWISMVYIWLKISQKTNKTQRKKTRKSVVGKIQDNFSSIPGQLIFCRSDNSDREIELSTAWLRWGMRAHGKSTATCKVQCVGCRSIITWIILFLLP